jgi:hypothetical protein
MKFLLDTMVVSEWLKARPFPGVVSWLAKADAEAARLNIARYC